MSQLPESRPFSHWALVPVGAHTGNGESYTDEASSELILEMLRTHAEIKSVGRSRFPGSLRQQNALWMDFRNYMRQALSNFEAASTVPNRSAALLLYYAMLNFAKAALLDTHAPQLVNKRVGHGLSFSPTAAASIRGDKLRVVDGVFPMLYERVVGRSIPIGTKLPIVSLLHQVPEITSQVRSVGLGDCVVSSVYPMLVSDGTDSWCCLDIKEAAGLQGEGTVTRVLLKRHFQLVQPEFDVRDRFGFSRRQLGQRLSVWQSKRSVPNQGSQTVTLDALSVLDDLSDILFQRTKEYNDGVLAPSLWKSRMLPMPPALARYALTYYVSSLVRYKPQMFDLSQSPEVAYLFDSVTRELAVPMLQDTLSWVHESAIFFNSPGAYRL